MAAIGINWQDIWNDVWNDVWTDVPPTPPAVSTTQAPAGRPTLRRRRFQVEIDGVVHEVASPDEALAVLQEARQEAEKTAAVAIERAAKATRRPVRKVMADARKALKVPDIQVSGPDMRGMASMLTQEIDQIFQSALASIEIAAIMAAQRAREESDDEDILLLL